MAESVGTVGTPDRNSKKVRAWCFTVNNYGESDLHELKLLRDLKPSRLVYQSEIGSSGTPHIQGVVYFKHARHCGGVSKLLKRAHWEQCDNVYAQYTYCSKKESSDGLIQYDSRKDLLFKCKDPLEGKVLYGWQRSILKIISEPPDGRSIYWIFEDRGCTGKTALAKHIILHNQDKALYVGGAGKDIKYAVLNFIKKHELEVVIYNLARTKEGYISYTSMEEICDGFAFSGKYESEQLVFNPPHVLVFSNFLPNREALSKDRWKIFEIIDNELDPWEFSD